MLRKAYVNAETYAKMCFHGEIPEEKLDDFLSQASRNVDSLTYNRIVGRGFDNLTAFQKETIQEVVCRQADFLYENQDVMNTILTSYSINGVSVHFGKSWNVKVQNGVAMKMDVYHLLCQTGFCCRLAR